MSGKIGSLAWRALLMACVVGGEEARGQWSQPAYAPSPSNSSAGAFAPPQPQLPQTAQGFAASQPAVLPSPAPAPQSYIAPPAYNAPTAAQPFQPQIAPAQFAQPQYVQPLGPPQAAPYPFPPPAVAPGDYYNNYNAPTPARPIFPASVYPISSRFWFQTDVLIWWTKSAPMPQPLVTGGSPNDAVPGALGQPSTQVLLGGSSINMPVVSGLRLEGGFWFDAERTIGVEAGYFFLGRQSRVFSAYDDGFGDPLIARPTIDAQSGTEGSYVDSYPGSVTGGITVIERSQLQGANIGPLMNFVQTDRFRLDGMLAFRYVNLTESLDITDQYADVQRGALTFGGAPIRYSDYLTDVDSFHTTNSFYGGSLGARMNWAPGRWLFGATGKVALGTMQERTVVNGFTTLNRADGSQATLPGGILATTANIGSYYRSPFAVVPEAILNVGYQITPWMTLRIGYSFLYLSNVLRPGAQVNRVTSANLVPSDPTYGTAGPNQPTYQFHTSSYWAQGMNVGLDFRF